jgi:predicted MFS family arabinose efflux permease
MVLQRHRWLVLAVLVFITVLAYADRGMLTAFAPQVTAELGLSNTQYGLLTGPVWVLAFGFMAPFLGSLADRYSRPRIIAGGMLVWSACTAASGWAQDFGHMVAARFFVASGEAALVPAATAIIAEIFDARRRGTANGLFFLGLPLGTGCAYLVSGTLGEALGWRHTFFVLGAIGVAIALPLALVPDERGRGHREDYGEPFLRQLRALAAELLAHPRVMLVIAGFMTCHIVFAQNSFLPLWLVRERGADAADVAREIGVMQIAFGGLGAIVGGLVGDRFAERLPGGHAAFPVLSLAVCVPLMVASRLVAPDNALFHAGLAANFFLPLSLYGCTIAVLQGSLPERMRATAVGCTMMCNNFVAIALGTLGAGAVSDRLAATGHAAPLGTVLLGTDLVAGGAIIFYLAAALLHRRAATAGTPR